MIVILWLCHVFLIFKLFLEVLRCSFHICSSSYPSSLHQIALGEKYLLLTLLRIQRLSQTFYGYASCTLLFSSGRVLKLVCFLYDRPGHMLMPPFCSPNSVTELKFMVSPWS